MNATMLMNIGWMIVIVMGFLTFFLGQIKIIGKPVVGHGDKSVFYFLLSLIFFIEGISEMSFPYFILFVTWFVLGWENYHLYKVENPTKIFCD